MSDDNRGDSENLTEEQYTNLIKELELFNEKFFIALVDTDRFEVVPTVTDIGKPLTKEQYSLIKHECSRLGLAIIYRMDMPNGLSVYINSKNKKIGYMHEGMH